MSKKHKNRIKKCLILIPEISNMPSHIATKIMVPPKSGFKKIKRLGKKTYMPEKTICLNLYISTCLIEKYLANKIIKTNLVGSIGSKEKRPILYHPLVPLISGAKKKRP